MADVVENTNAEVTVEDANVESGENTPSLDDVLAELAEQKAQAQKNKQALDKALKEKGELTKTLRSKQTTEEREQAEREEAEREREQQLADALAELNEMKAKNAYTGTFDDEQTISNMVACVSEGDHKGIALIVQNAVDNAVKKAQNEWLKNRPQANLGTDSSMTKEQILAIEDDDERIRAIAQHRNLF